MSSFVYEFTNYPIRVVKTAFIGLIMAGLSLSVAAVGPALLDLQMLTGTTIEKATLLLPVRAIGYVAGSVIGGIAGDHLDHQKVLIFFMIIAIITLALLALFKSIVVMYSIIFVLGTASGAIDTVLVSSPFSLIGDSFHSTNLKSFC